MSDPRLNRDIFAEVEAEAKAGAKRPAPLCTGCAHFNGINGRDRCLRRGHDTPTRGWETLPRRALVERGRWPWIGDRCGPQARFFKPIERPAPPGARAARVGVTIDGVEYTVDPAVYRTLISLRAQLCEALDTVREHEARILGLTTMLLALGPPAGAPPEILAAWRELEATQAELAAEGVRP